MIRAKLIFLARRITLSVVLSAGVLSIANVDSIWQEQNHADDLADARKIKSQQIFRERLKLAQNPKREAAGSPASEFRASLTSDELGEINPFAALATVEPLGRMIGLGIVNFERETYRSPKYKEETGYDVVHYDIEHRDGAHSSVLAYLEQDFLNGEKRAVVVFLKATAAGHHYSLYKGGVLVDQSMLPADRAQEMVAQRLSSAIPFMSVAR